jgi:hypothetical protein
MDRDISFTDALNVALAAAFAVPKLPRRVQWRAWASLLEGSDWERDGSLARSGTDILGCIDTVFQAEEPADVSAPADAQVSGEPVAADESGSPVSPPADEAGPSDGDPDGLEHAEPMIKLADKPDLALGGLAEALRDAAAAYHGPQSKGKGARQAREQRETEPISAANW